MTTTEILLIVFLYLFCLPAGIAVHVIIAGNKKRNDELKKSSDEIKQLIETKSKQKDI